MKNIWLKFILLSLIFSLWIYFWQKEVEVAFWEKEIKIEEEKDYYNKLHFSSAKISHIAHSWVALSVNVWTKKLERIEWSVEIYTDVLNVWDIISNKMTANDKIIWTNMIILSEYINVMKTDLKRMLDNSYDREATLEAYIDQLEYRKYLADESIANLRIQYWELKTSQNKSTQNITTLWEKMSKDFKNLDEKSTLENILKYWELKEEETIAKTYSIFTGEFVKAYENLNNQNIWLIKTLKANKDIIIKNSKIVIPTTWTKYLKDLELIYSES